MTAIADVPVTTSVALDAEQMLAQVTAFQEALMSLVSDLHARLMPGRLAAAGQLAFTGAGLAPAADEHIGTAAARLRAFLREAPRQWM